MNNIVANALRAQRVMNDAKAQTEAVAYLGRAPYCDEVENLGSSGVRYRSEPIMPRMFQTVLGQVKGFIAKKYDTSRCVVGRLFEDDDETGTFSVLLPPSAFEDAPGANAVSDSDKRNIREALEKTTKGLEKARSAYLEVCRLKNDMWFAWSVLNRVHSPNAQRDAKMLNKDLLAIEDGADKMGRAVDSILGNVQKIKKFY